MSAPQPSPVVRVINDGDHSAEYFEQELEKALDNNCDIIVIEPVRLGEETVHWIKVGNYLHRIAVISGIPSICINVAFYRNHYAVTVPLTVMSVFCAGLYMISWQFDPCCKYQVVSRVEKINASELSPETLYYNLLESAPKDSASPVIIVKKDDTVRKVFHTIVAVFALTLTIFRACK
ncbi:transmembrane protein 11-A, mitochondrial [Planococcus citri]|uniref:transmembrane protein 11-A, mitochondrial n=1 Tax=Planococcus citri TaxID=170843 RepID=UPI0031F950CB